MWQTKSVVHTTTLSSHIRELKGRQHFIYFNWIYRKAKNIYSIYLSIIPLLSHDFCIYVCRSLLVVVSIRLSFNTIANLTHFVVVVWFYKLYIHHLKKLSCVDLQYPSALKKKTLNSVSHSQYTSGRRALLLASSYFSYYSNLRQIRSY